MRKPGLIIAVLLLGACRNTDITDPSITSSVVVSSTLTQIVVGETAQATAVVKDQDGNTLSGKSVSWISLNSTIATVSSTGVIRGVAPGTATIQGSVDGITGTAAIQVVASSAVCAAGPAVVNLAIGQVSVLSSIDTQGCVRIAGVTEPSQYYVIAANLNPLPDAFPSLGLRSDPAESLSLNSVFGESAGASSAPAESTPLASSLQTRFESDLRAIERRELRLTEGQRAYAESLRPGTAFAMAVPAVGDKTSFRVPRSCTDFKTVTGTVKHISTRAIIYTDDAAPAGGFTDSDLQAIAQEFDTLIYPTDTEYFGSPLDLDSNSRIIIIYTPEVNRLTPAGSPTGFVGGFFFAGDLFPTSTCPQANRAEIFYLLAPDPAGTINGNVRTVSQVRQGTRGTIAHEFQHMINASERIRHPVTTELESIWLDEALAHFAEDLNGRVLRNLGETGNYTFDQLTNNGTQTADFSAFFFQNFARLGQYLSSTAINAPTSQYTDSSLADRGAAWSLLRYAADHHAPNGDIKAMMRSLVPGPDTGVVNLRSKAGGVQFDSLVAGWLVANAVDDLGVAGFATKYSYKTYNMRSNVGRVNPQGNAYSLAATEIPATIFTKNFMQVRSASGAYFRFSRTAGAPSRIIRLTNTDMVTAATYGGAHLIIFRTQ